MSKQGHGRDLTGTEMAMMLDEFVNGATDSQMRDFVEQLTDRTHRTLQQRCMALFVQTIEAWANKREHDFDLRNEATVRLAKKIVAATGDKYDRYLPLI